MRSPFRFTVLSGVIGFLILTLGYADSIQVIPAAVSPSLSGPSPGASISPADQTVLLKKFEKFQKDNTREILVRQQEEMRALKENHKNEKKAFNEKEKAARKTFFETPRKRPEVQAFMKDFITRKEDLERRQKTEVSKKKAEDEKGRRLLLEQNVLKLKEFKSTLDRGETPAPDFWIKPIASPGL